MTALVDIGVNLTNTRFRGDLDGVIEGARAAGVAGMIVTGTSVAGSEAALALARPRGLTCTAGVHPHDAKSVGPGDLDRLRELAAAPEVVAIGECGLDYNRDFSPRPIQRTVFAAQLDLAVELGLPVFLHERDAHADFVELLAPRMPRLPAAVVHCFTGSAAALDRYLEMGAYIGITGWICDERRGEALRRDVARIPLDRLLVETDAPYLLPRDLRPRPKGGRNEPRFLPHVVQAVAGHLGRPFAEVAAATTANATRVFGAAVVGPSG